MAEVGEIRVAAYVAGGFLSPESGYAATLRELGADGSGHVLIAVAARAEAEAGGHEPETADRAAAAQTEAEVEVEKRGPETAGQAGAQSAHGAQTANGRISGTIMLQVWPYGGQVVTGPGEAEIRALAVRPEAQGAGVGGQLLRAVIELAARLGTTHLVLSTEPEMRTAHRLYERAGFVRLPERDWSPVPGVNLLVYGLRLA